MQSHDINRGQTSSSLCGSYTTALSQYTMDERIAKFEASDAYHKYQEFREQMFPRLREVQNPRQYLDLAEEWRLFHNKVHVVRECPLGR